MTFAEQFKAYVSNEPADKPVDHTSWSACALGEFVRDTNYPAGRYMFEATTAFEQAFGGRAYHMLGMGGRRVKVGGVLVQIVPMDTYGELSVWLNGLTVIDPIAETDDLMQ